MPTMIWVQPYHSGPAIILLLEQITMFCPVGDVSTGTTLVHLTCGNCVQITQCYAGLKARLQALGCVYNTQ